VQKILGRGFLIGFRLHMAFQYSGPWNEQNRNLMTGETRALEAGNAARITHKLPGLDFGHSYNTAPCGHRFFPVRSNQELMNSFFYVSFEMIEGACMCAICLFNMLLSNYHVSFSNYCIRLSSSSCRTRTWSQIRSCYGLSTDYFSAK